MKKKRELEISYESDEFDLITLGFRKKNNKRHENQTKNSTILTIECKENDVQNNEITKYDIPKQEYYTSILMTKFYDKEFKTLVEYSIKIDNNERKNEYIYWFKGKEIAKYLEYNNTEQAIRTNVNSKDIITLGELYKKSDTFKQLFHSGLKGNDKNIKYINQYGIISLTLRSRMPKAKEFEYWVTHEVLASIINKGSFTLNKNNNYFTSIINNNKMELPLQDDESENFNGNISDYHDKTVLYIGFIGKYNNELLYKYGISNRILKRIQKEHVKTFDTFNLKFIIESDNYKMVENLFEAELIQKGIHRTIILNENKYTELFTVTKHYSLYHIKEILTNIVDKNQLPKQMESNNELIKLQNEYDHQKQLHDVNTENIILKYENQNKKLENDYLKQINDLNIKIIQLELQNKIKEFELQNKIYKLESQMASLYDFSKFCSKYNVQFNIHDLMDLQNNKINTELQDQIISENIMIDNTINTHNESSSVEMI